MNSINGTGGVGFPFTTVANVFKPYLFSILGITFVTKFVYVKSTINDSVGRFELPNVGSKIPLNPPPFFSQVR